jgi:hypothetical protein
MERVRAVGSCAFVAESLSSVPMSVVVLSAANTGIAHETVNSAHNEVSSLPCKSFAPLWLWGVLNASGIVQWDTAPDGTAVGAPAADLSLTTRAPTSFSSRWNSGDAMMIVPAAARRRSTASSGKTKVVGC